jgi:phthalate 4,5-cis-dihydrodiol dehydrogenase
MKRRKLRIGFAGLGMGAARIMQEIAHLDFVEIVAGADLREPALQKFRTQYSGDAYKSVEEMCKNPNVEAVYVATPHEYHAEHAITAMNNGKHVVVEKPMATTLDEAQAMNEAAERNRVNLLCGHTHSFDAPVRAMMQVVRSGELGRLLMINSSYYKNFMYRPWSDHDVEVSRGIVLNQGPHQVDIVRLIGGGLVKSVRATAARWDPTRPGEGHYVCYLEFESGAVASLVFNGYALFDTAELVWDIGEGGGRPKNVEEDLEARRFMRSLSGPDRAQKIEQRLEQWRFGGTHEGEWFKEVERQHQPFFGLTIVTCEHGEIRQSPDGLYIYTEAGRREVRLKQGVDARIAEMEEFYDAIMSGRPVFHDGRWGQSTLEVCLGILQSTEQKKEIYMKHQLPVPAFKEEALFETN